MMDAVRPVDPRLLREGSTARPALVATVVCGVLSAALIVAQAWLISRGIVNVFQNNESLAQLRPLAIGAVAVFLARALVAWAQEVAAARASAQVKAQVRDEVLAQATALGPIWLTGQRRGELTILLTRGLDALDGYFGKYLPQLVLSVIVPLVVVAVVATEDLASALIIIVTLPLIPLFMVLIGWTTQRQQDRQWSALELLSGYFLDLVSGLPTLKVFGRAEAQADNLRRITGEYRRRTMTVLRVTFLSSFALELLATISVALVAVFIGVRLVSGELDLATGLFVLVIAPEAYLPLRQVGLHFHASQEGVAAATRAFDLLAEPLAADGDVTQCPDLRTATITFVDVTAQYPARALDAVRHLNLTIRPGETLALVGPSGAGKSTVLQLLLRLLEPSAGRIEVGTSEQSVDPRDLTAATWREQIAYVPQTPGFVAGTIADNVRLVAPEASDARVEQSLREAGAWDFVVALPDGIRHELADRGAGLSAGQRQRIALARAFVRDAPLVVLDEPTAALDAESEQRVVDAVTRLAADRTVVLVAHRPALAAIADRVVAVSAVEPDTEVDVAVVGAP
jgi:ATP-binding cassette, subfamily C, bacterial CydCD